MSRERLLTAQRTNASISPDLRVPGWLGRSPIIGVILFLVGTAIFGAFAYNLQANGPLVQWDTSLADQFGRDAAKAPHRMMEMLIFGFFVGKQLLQVVVIILGLYFLHKRFWPELAMLLIGSGGGAILWYLIIRIFERPRPVEQFGIVVTDPSFPSGHAISSVICYGLLAYILIPKMPSRFWKWLLGIAIVFTILYVGFSRAFLGGHYMTDILAGYGLGLAWAGLVFTIIERLFLRKKKS